MATTQKNAPAQAPRRRISWNDPGFRAVIYQVVAVGLVALTVWFLVSNTLHNLAVRNISTGFGFLNREAGFAIGETLISYSPSDTYGRAILVGLLNTLRVAVLGIVLATILGTLIGIGRLSKNWLVARLTSVYVEVMRNVPLLLQLFFWYALITENMPGPRQAHNPLPGVFVSNRGVKVPEAVGASLDWILLGLGLAIIATLVLGHWAKKRQHETGRVFPLGRVAVALLIACPLVGWIVSGMQLSLSLPELKGFNFQGGLTLTPEFAALLAGLVIYTSAFIAEVVRSGIQAVSSGQWEAASSLGLRRSQVLRLVVLPQALRVIIPPMTSQYLNLTKNSSLAVAIGYPDIVSVVNTTLNQTGQAIEGILIIMAAYLTVSLSISIFMNWYNKRIALVER
ncbi:amino acid ABC transporter permease [Bordetella holmesii]|uniref:ABC transporter, permease protein n=2 Tax=Bordetella holmesii TaxID=35814 RepID=A0A158M9D0_9BORD|nr:amino acid ABC transporter permease [Bordetella holmesii]AHV92188.1 amino ABC transporter, permease, 3-TM region, His/Glu/Gln/Arg/opine family domain protein [Bordetella holmesii ATCC 51541]AIT26561.1 amino ABC transporter, permease, 3-TM region, His/Glu/Gln/Arg/opine family domain protein [Bordetella holmesii 44057]EWM42405.1 amino ABC transporter, permease, 3-TM region, His/Glu/Gln/Arg/opine family domain protein [Bordetella holmesii 41130]EWM47140.1 amino ABC transporter, permease, 3-TM r